MLLFSLKKFIYIRNDYHISDLPYHLYSPYMSNYTKCVHDTIIIQVSGTKYVVLYPSSDGPNLYPHQSPILFNTSQVDLQVSKH